MEYSKIQSNDISQWITINPFKNTTILPIKIQVFSDTDEKIEAPVVGPGSLSSIPLDPPGPVSLYLWHTDPEYRAGNFITRKMLLRKAIITFNEKFDQELKGREWKPSVRVKVIEQLQEQESSAVSPPMTTTELSRAICFVLGFQYVEVDEIHKKVFWYPLDIRTWTNEQPIYLVSQGCRSIYVKKVEEDARPFFKTWLFDLVEKDYVCLWPITDGTVKELKAKLETFCLTIRKTKPLKDDYCSTVGKAEAISHINATF